MRRMITVCMVGCCFLLGLVVAQGDQEVLLRYKFQPGQQLIYRLQTVGSGNLSLGGLADLGLHDVMPTTLPMRVTYDMLVGERVLSVDTEGNATLELSYGPVNYTGELLGQSVWGTMNLLTGDITMNAERFRIAQPQLAGPPRVVLSPGGRMLSAQNLGGVLQLWESFASLARPMLQQQAATVSPVPLAAFPPGPVAVGSTWQQATPPAAGQVATAPVIQGSYRLAGFQQLAGRNCAVIDCQVQMGLPAGAVPVQLQASQGMVSSMVAGLTERLSGRIYFDPQLGQMVRGDFWGTLNTSNTTTGQATVLGQCLNLNDLFELQGFSFTLTVALQ